MHRTNDPLNNPHLAPMLARFGLTVEDVKRSGVLERMARGDMFGRLDPADYQIGGDMAARAGR